jgi:DnaJ homolog subfamily C member 2
VYLFVRRKERQEQLLAKERLLEEKRLEKMRIEEERIQQEQLQLQQEEQSKIQKQQEKIQREQYKKLLRKSKQTLRKSVSASFDQDLLLLQQQQQADMDKLEDEVNEKNNEQQPLWNDLYDLNQDIDYLCTRLTLEEINALNENLTEYASDNDEYGGSHRLLLEFVYQHIQEQKVKEQADSAANGNNVVKLATNTANTTNVWSTAELSTLIKAMKKYPMGGAGRWDAICNMINHNCTLAVPRTRQECIDKYNSMLKKQQLQNKNNNNSSMGTTSNGVPDAAVTTANTNATTGHTTASNGGATNVDTGDTTSLKQQQSTDDAIDDANDANHSETWSTDQDQLLQEALLLYPATMEKNERWSLIASHIPNKNKKACVQRFKTIRQEIISSQQAPSSTSK